MIRIQIWKNREPLEDNNLEIFTFHALVVNKEGQQIMISNPSKKELIKGIKEILDFIPEDEIKDLS